MRSIWVCLCVSGLLAAAAGAAETVWWPQFRGPLGTGIVVPADGKSPIGLPTAWSDTQNVVWKTETPLKGWSTPAIVGKDIWFTASDPEGHDYYALCADAETGVIRFNQKLFHSDNPEPLGNNVNGYASCSPCVEPGRAYIHFGSYGTACLESATGKILWQRNDLPCRHYRGPGSSAVLYGDLLILTFDGADFQYLAALDKNSGKTVWKTDRTTTWKDLEPDGKPIREGDLRKSYTTPVIVPNGGKPVMISGSSYCVFGYDPKTGKELWKLPNDAFTAASSAVYDDKGMAYCATGRGKSEIQAIKIDGTGDISKNVVWRVEGTAVPQEPSPILVDGLLYVVNNNGLLTCFNAADGAQIYAEHIGGNYVTSPIFADGKLYFSSVQGKTTVVQTGKEFKVLSVNALEGGFMASPAVYGKSLILRSKTHLYRIEEGAAAK